MSTITYILMIGVLLAFAILMPCAIMQSYRSYKKRVQIDRAICEAFNKELKRGMECYRKDFPWMFNPDGTMKGKQ